MEETQKQVTKFTNRGIEYQYIFSISSCVGFTANRILTNFLKYLDYHQPFNSVCFLQLFSGDKSKSNFFVHYTDNILGSVVNNIAI